MKQLKAKTFTKAEEASSSQAAAAASVAFAAPWVTTAAKAAGEINVV